MSVSENITTPHLRVAANIADTAADIINVYAFSFVTEPTETDLNGIDSNWVDANQQHITTLSDPHTGYTSKTFDQPSGIVMSVLGYITQSFESFSNLVPTDASSSHHVYIMTKNKLGFIKVVKS
jgi:hypothetical protein